MTVRAMKAGAVEFLTKPLREQDVLDAVKVALERDRVERDKERSLHNLQARFDALSDREREVVLRDCRLDEQTNRREDRPYRKHRESSPA